MKKILSLFLIISLIFSISFIALAADYNDINYLLLGDSIARGAGVLNPDEACYGSMVSNTAGFNYENYGEDGFQSFGLLSKINEKEVLKSIENADIISISIGGNDFLQGNLLQVVFEGLKGNFDPVDKKLETFYDNFSQIIGRIKEVNSHAIILVQTLYNPRYDFTRDVYEEGVKRLNKCYYRYLDENPGAYEIIDVYSALDGRKDCVAIDTIHPNGTGNIIIARLILTKLRSLGFSVETEPVILIEPLESSGFGIRYLIRLVLYYVNYWLKRI